MKNNSHLSYSCCCLILILVFISPIQQRSVRDLTLEQILPDKIPDLAYKWIKQLLGGISNGYNLTIREVENECMDEEFRSLMNQSYFYWIKAPPPTPQQQSNFSNLESLPQMNRKAIHNTLIQKIKKSFGLSSRSQMPILLLVGQLLNDCEWSQIVQDLVGFYSLNQSSIYWSVGWRLALLVPLVILELPLIATAVLFSFTQLGYLMGANLKMITTI